MTEPWNDVDGDQEERLKDEPPWPETARSVEKKRFSLPRLAIGAATFRALVRPAIGVAIFVVIVGVGILVYQQFAPAPKVWPVRPATTPSPAPTKPRDAQPESQVPPVKSAVGSSEPASKGPESLASAPAVPASPPAPSMPSSPAPAAPAPSPELPQAPSLQAEPAPQPPAKPFYSVQIGAYRDEANAQDFAKKFLDKGYDAFVQVGVTKDKSPIYRVLVSKSEDKKTARKLAEEIRSKERIQTTLFGD